MKMRRMGLDTLRPGEQCVLRQIRLPAAQRMRLEELGLLPGTRIQCLYQAPCGTPAAYAVSGAVFALRRKDAARLRDQGAPKKQNDAKASYHIIAKK